jgi:malate dehydrogenase (oxaloacetate-decarboxylating)(NADP+)
VPAGKVEVVQPDKSPKFAGYAKKLHELRWRRGVALEDAEKATRDPVVFGNLMVREGDADGLVSGLTMHYPETIRPALQVHHTRPGVSRAAGIYVLLFEERMVFIADTTVNEDPTAEQLAEIAWMTAQVVKNFEVEPRIAMLSYSNFGSTPDARSYKVRRAVDIVRERWPELIVDGEMQADTAVEPSIAEETYPLSAIKGDANVLICPDLQSANIAYKLLWRLGKVEAIGPILTGINALVQVLQRGVEVNDIVNMAAMCVLQVERMRDLKGEKAKK